MLELTVPQKQRIVFSKWPLHQAKDKVQSKKESPLASQTSFIATKEIKKKKKAKFDIILTEEKEPTLAEFL